MKNNLRDVFTCKDCKYEISDEGYSYCNLDNSVPVDWWKQKEKEWQDEHFVGDYQICDDFEE
jgi:hypothetical protein